MSAYNNLPEGVAAPWFKQRNTSNPTYAFDTVAGRYIVLCFFATAADAIGKAALQLPMQHRDVFNDERAAFFGVSIDAEDERTGRVREVLPGIRHFWDFDGLASRLYGALPIVPGGENEQVRRQWVVLDPALSVIRILPFKTDGSDRAALIALLNALPPVSHYGGIEMHAPIIILPNVFDTALCAHLVSEYERKGGKESGFMSDVDGKTVTLSDKNHKSRSDFTIEDAALRQLLARQVQLKVAPVIKKIHSFDATRMERYLVGCYDVENGGHFLPHRDNTTKGTAHRRFALSVNLNDDFEGGELSFPEYGTRSYKCPAGGAIIFSGSLLHAVSPVRRGRRYAFLPFLYDDAAAAVRRGNLPFLAIPPEQAGETS
ncbi:MAG: 2OG-Fe(II) oxygenase [Pseudomonadota bacterium]